MLSRVLSRMFNESIINNLRTMLITNKPKLVKKDYIGIDMPMLLNQINNTIQTNTMTFPLAFDIINSQVPLSNIQTNQVYCKLIEGYKKEISLRNLNLLLSLYNRSPVQIQAIYTANKLYLDDFLSLVADKSYQYDIIGILYVLTLSAKNWVFSEAKIRKVLFGYVHTYINNFSATELALATACIKRMAKYEEFDTLLPLIHKKLNDIYTAKGCTFAGVFTFIEMKMLLEYLHMVQLTKKYEISNVLIQSLIASIMISIEKYNTKRLKNLRSLVNILLYYDIYEVSKFNSILSAQSEKSQSRDKYISKDTLIILNEKIKNNNGNPVNLNKIRECCPIIMEVMGFNRDELAIYSTLLCKIEQLCKQSSEQSIKIN